MIDIFADRLDFNADPRSSKEHSFIFCTVSIVISLANVYGVIIPKFLSSIV